MPSARSSDSDNAARLKHELSLVSKAVLDQEFTGDDWMREFQRIDPLKKGFISSRSEVIDTICGSISQKYQGRIDFDLIMKAFPTKHGQFDYPHFCESFEKTRAEKVASRSSFKVVHKSPKKSPSKRSNWLIEQQQHTYQTGDDTPRDLDATTQRMRVDPRLESQRLVSSNVQRKLLNGVIGAQYGGFKGLQDLLFYLDEQGNGYVDEEVFEREILHRLNKPLSKQEIEFLLAHLRVHTGDMSRPVIHYEHLATLCNLDSDVSAEDTETDTVGIPSNSPTKSTHYRVATGLVSVGGADLFSAEKTLRQFLQKPIAMPSQIVDIENTPRSVVTGAEMFLESAEKIDSGMSGLLDEHDFHDILAKYDLSIAPNLVRTMLERFPRSADQKIDYRVFLERYAENPQLARERRRLKRLLSNILSSVESSRVDPWFEYLTHRFSKYDSRQHNRVRGSISDRDFVRVLQGRSGPVKVPVETTTEILAQFLRVSRGSSSSAVLYHEFLRLLRDCRAPPKTPDAPAASPRPPTPPPTASTNVADYLINDASDEERQHFEELMEVLNKFQQRVANKSASRANPAAPGGSIDAERNGECPPSPNNASQPASNASTPRAGEVSPVANGILLSLGAKLQVQIQFAVRE